ncbi:MAG TPA: hypothetical protein VFP98_09860, partial [Candidatus Polarisedimenticolia bacterium]|nr:hypothetical protein [Candidatus Polarisedimenticolia bacterium]
LADYPLLLEYRRFTSPLFGEEESLEVTGVRLPSVDEILARHQAFQAAQDALLVNLRAEARVDYHFKIGSGSTVDVTLLNNFYLDPNVGAEFEQKEFRVGGVKWRSDRIPEFPLPQPEKVMTLPLDIALDKRYGYRLAGEETIDGYACWVIEFDPVVPDASLYRGRVWIDSKTFAKVQIASVQTGLEPPILSNDETDSYRPIRGPDGIEYWVLSRIDGQQIFSTSGRNLILVREVAFTDHVINDAGFVELRRQAYASERSILRDTPSGQKYLERTPEGDRVVKENVDRDNLFGLGGVYYNRSLDFPVPLAGINYFNRDLGGRGIQTNVFFAGVLLFANLSDPDLFGVGLEGSVDLSARGFSATDRPVRLGEERDEESIDRISQRLGLGLGIPFADYWKVKLTGGLEFDGFSRDEETDPRAIDPAFVAVIPQDTWILTYGMEGEFNRDAWSVAASVEVSDRRDWDCWGFFDPSLASCSAEFRPESQDYMRYQGTVARDFFLPFHQKIHASVTGYGGGDLDRFSKYQFDFFSNRLRGLSGAGLRFTNGARAQIQYAFNLGEIIRFEATVDHARVRDRSPADPGEDDFRGFTGFGISGQTIVGPDLIVSLDYGIAVSSDSEDVRGDQEVLLSILRIFR